MIAHLRGNVDRITHEYVVVDVHGVGFQVFMPYGSLVSIVEDGKPITLLTKYVVREDSVALYGFLKQDELVVFEYLLGIQGIGPKAAMNVLSAFSPAHLKDIVLQEDYHALTAVSGIGKKTAQRMVIDLLEKMKKFLPQEDAGYKAAGKDFFQEAKEALSELGFSSSEIDKALRTVRSQVDAVGSVQDILRIAMKLIKDE